jgi:hypothetical protein
MKGYKILNPFIFYFNNICFALWSTCAERSRSMLFKFHFDIRRTT